MQGEVLLCWAVPRGPVYFPWVKLCTAIPCQGECTYRPQRVFLGVRGRQCCPDNGYIIIIYCILVKKISLKREIVVRRIYFCTSYTQGVG